MYCLNLRLTLAGRDFRHPQHKTGVEWPVATLDIHVRAQCMTFPT